MSVNPGVICIAKPGEDLCGDGWMYEGMSDRGLYSTVDGLGHGPLAAEASVAAVTSIRQNITGSPAEQIERAHGALRSTRGAAMAVAEILYEQGLVRFAGIGNVSASIVQGQETRSMVSQNGIVGHQVRRVTEYSIHGPSRR